MSYDPHYLQKPLFGTPTVNDNRFNPPMATPRNVATTLSTHVDTNEYKTPDAHFAWTGQYLYDKNPPGVSIGNLTTGGHGPQLPPAVQANLNQMQAHGSIQPRGA